MKKLLLIIPIFVYSFCYGQKINSCNYRNVDTIVQYKNGETICYKNKRGKLVIDTIWYPLRCNVNIKQVDVLIIDEKKIMRRHK